MKKAIAHVQTIAIPAPIPVSLTSTNGEIIANKVIIVGITHQLIESVKVIIFFLLYGWGTHIQNRDQSFFA